MSEIIKCLRIGNLLVIPTRGVIAGADGIHRVSSTNIRVLMALVSQRGDSVSHSDLCEMAECDREDLPQHLESLKQALGDTGSQARFVVVNDNHVNLIAPVHDGAGQHQNLLREVLELDNQLTFFQQLLRRKVIRVGAAYIVLAWVVIQVADTVLPRLGFPSWAITLTIAIAMLGFPLAVGIAWLFEATSFGKLREESNRPAPLTGRQKLVDLTAIVSVAAIIGYVAVGVIADVRKAKNREDLSIATSSSIPAANTIAVLPFTQLGGLADQTYIGDGIAEEVLRLLSRLKELNVAARAASFYYKGKDVDIQSMATRLKVRHLLTGSVQVIGNAIRINAEVVDTSTGYQVWSESFDREMDDVFAIQTEIARAVADGSQVVLSEESESELDFRPTNNLEAYDYYLRGRDYLNQPRTVDTLRDARRLFHRALALDPDYALALSGLCETHLGLFIRTKSVASVDDAESTCRAALEIDPSLLEVHTALGNLYWNSGNYEQAEDEFRWAIQQNPRFYQAYAGLGDTLYSQKQLEESLLAYQQLVELQPAYWHGYQRLGAYYYRQGNDQEALRYFQHVTDLSPDNAPGWNNLGAVNYMLGNLESAATAWQRSLDIAPAQSTYANLGTMYYYLGRFDDAIEMQRSAVETAPNDYRTWGRLAAAYYQVDGREAESVAAYNRAISLAEDGLVVNSNDSDALKNIALFHARLGDTELAIAGAEKALDLSPQDPDTHFFAAMTYHAIGDIEKCYLSLEQAVKLGYAKKLISAEPALASLHGQDRFEFLIAVQGS